MLIQLFCQIMLNSQVVVSIWYVNGELCMKGINCYLLPTKNVYSTMY